MTYLLSNRLSFDWQIHSRPSILLGPGDSDLMNEKKWGLTNRLLIRINGVSAQQQHEWDHVARTCHWTSCSVNLNNSDTKIMCHRPTKQWWLIRPPLPRRLSLSQKATRRTATTEPTRSVCRRPCCTLHRPRTRCDIPHLIQAYNVSQKRPTLQLKYIIRA